MLTCVPQSICSWDYHVFDSESNRASLSFNFWSEQGAVYCRGVEYAIRKHGPLSGRWTLESNGVSYADSKHMEGFANCAAI